MTYFLLSYRYGGLFGADFLEILPALVLPYQQPASLAASARPERGELTRCVPLPIDETQRAEPHPRSGPALEAAGRSPAGVKQWQSDVLDRARPREEVEALEDKTDALASDARERGFGELRHVEALEQHWQCRRARARWS
jgi:hypothetical protein